MGAWIRNAVRRGLDRARFVRPRVVHTRPRDLVVVPRAGGIERGRRAVLFASRFEDGFAAAGGTIATACGAGGELMILSGDGGGEPAEAVRARLEPCGVRRLLAGSLETDDEDLRARLTDFSPEIAFVPSPVEDGDCWRVSARLLVGSRVPETILLYELYGPLMPDRIVDVTEWCDLKDTSEAGALALLLNQYRSATNMGGRGLSEAFHAVSPGTIRDPGGRGRVDELPGEPGRIPFYEGLALLAGARHAGEPWERADRSVLVLSPHFDDEAIGCGGTMVRHQEAGDRVTVAFVTDGSAGDPRESDPALVSRIRREEALEATEVLGVRHVEFLDEPETRLRPRPELERRMAVLFEEVGPDVIYLPSYLDNHIDHLALNRLVYRVLRRTGAAPEVRLFPLWTLIPPNLTVDITELADLKARAVNRYRSQITQVDYLSVVSAINRYWAIRYGNDPRGCHEVFHACSAGEYIDRMERLGLDREFEW